MIFTGQLGTTTYKKVKPIKDRKKGILLRKIKGAYCTLSSGMEITYELAAKLNPSNTGANDKIAQYNKKAAAPRRAEFTRQILFIVRSMVTMTNKAVINKITIPHTDNFDT